MALPQHPLISARRPWWQPLLSLLVAAYGIVFQGWGTQTVVFLFWWETILIVGAALVRSTFALDDKPVTATLGIKLVTLVFGVVIGGAAIMLAVAFSIHAVDDLNAEVLADTHTQSQLLLASYAIGLLVHYFYNGRFKTASVVGEMMQSLMHLVFVLALIMPVTMHILPAYPHLDAARWVALTVVIVKFLGDTVFARVDVTRVWD